jgi:hypothetical protein
MRHTDCLVWFLELEGQFLVLRSQVSEGCFDLPGAHGWLTEADSLIYAVLPVDHVCAKDWSSFEAPIRCGNTETYCWDRLFAIFQAAHRLVRHGRLGSFIDLIRAETEGELLDQASELIKNGALSAATVMAGGALETHLGRLVSRYGLPIKGDGSISRYNDAISQARNSNQRVSLTSADGKLVTYWGDMRNLAAHKPLEFRKSEQEVELMIHGIRSFISRTT